ncbi:hypothetical protein LguiA_025402 [Lonicera macranthoides]
MKYLRSFLILAMFMALIISVLSTPSEEQVIDDEDETTILDEEQTTSLRGASRFLALKTRATMTCNKYPRVCRAKGSSGPDCCKKKCVNVKTDRLNCGACGKKCKYGEICCKGQCVNQLSNKRHCGGCGNKCDKGGLCVYGLCSYA